MEESQNLFQRDVMMDDADVGANGHVKTSNEKNTLIENLDVHGDIP
jgi:hypothetical protein